MFSDNQTGGMNQLLPPTTFRGEHWRPTAASAPTTTPKSPVIRAPRGEAAVVLELQQCMVPVEHWLLVL